MITYSKSHMTWIHVNYILLGRNFTVFKLFQYHKHNVAYHPFQMFQKLL